MYYEPGVPPGYPEIPYSPEPFVKLALEFGLFTFMSGEPVFGGLRDTDSVHRDRSKLHWQTAVCF